MKEVRYCEKCGEKLDDESGLCPVCDIDTLNKVVRSGNIFTKIMPAVYITMFLVFCMFIANAHMSGVDSRKFVDETVKHYISNDVDWLAKHICSNYSYANMIPDDASVQDHLKTKIGETAKKLNETIMEKGYTLDFIVADISDTSLMVIEDYNNNNPNSSIEAKESNRADVEITARKGSLYGKADLKVNIIYEGHKWKILSFN